MATDATHGWSQPTLTFAIALACLVFYSLVKAYRARRFFYSLRQQGLPIAEWNWIFGGLLGLKKQFDALPPGADDRYVLAEIALKSEKGAAYIDFWPLFTPLLDIASPVLASQLDDYTSSISRGPGVNEGINKVTGGPTMLTLSDSPWKQWRTLFSPGFSPSYMLEQTPRIIHCVEAFADNLRERAKQDKLFPLEEDTLRLALDVIGIVALGREFEYQRNPSAILRSLRAMVEYTNLRVRFNPFKILNPVPRLLTIYHDRLLQREISAELDKAFAQRKNKSASPRQKVKSIIALAMDAYCKEKKLDKDTLDPEFKFQASTQIRMFLFAGHDTTSSTIVYTYHQLAQNPACLARLRAEHDAVLGRDISTAAARLAKDPVLSNQLHYTTACIKETLRLYPPAGRTRVGSPDVILTDEDGVRYPTAGTVIMISHFGLHRNPRHFPDPNAFIPDRWLVGPDDPLHPPKEAFRPFEYGARNCIGQTLAMLEMKIVFALTAREFDVAPAYDEWDRLHPSRRRAKAKTAFGDRAYGVSDTAGGSHPAHRYPCRVKVRT